MDAMSFSADELRDHDDAIGYQSEVLDHVTGVVGKTHNQDFPGGKFHVTADSVFMIVTDIAGFENEPKALHRELLARLEHRFGRPKFQFLAL